MQKTIYQRPEIRDSGNNVIQTGTYGKNSAFANAQNTGIIDYINNNLEAHETQINLLLQSSGQYNNISNIGTQLTNFSNEIAQFKLDVNSSLADYRTEANALSNTVASNGEAIAQQSSENVKQNDNINLLNRKVSALEKMNEGVSYRFETDDTEAYQKVIRSGAKAFDLKMLGGKSIVYGNMWSNYTHVDGNSNVNIVANNGAYTLTGTTKSVGYILSNAPNRTTIAGHKYLAKMVYLRNNNSSSDVFVYNDNAGVMATVNNNYEVIAEATGNKPVYLRVASGITLDCDLKVIFCDLTQAFGAGNEPTSLTDERVQAIITYGLANHVTNPQIVSASVGNVKIQGQNYLDLSKFAEAYPNNCTYDKATDTLTVNQTSFDMYNIGIPLVIRNFTGTLRATVKSITATNPRLEIVTSKDVMSVFDNHNTYRLSQVDVKYARINWSVGGSFTISNAQLAFGDESVPYKPYTETNITIPNECTDLKSAGEISDSIEMFEENGKKYIRKVQRVGSVDLGSIAGWRYSNGFLRTYQSNVNYIKLVANSTSLGNAICMGYPVMSWNAIKATDTGIALSYGTGNDLLITNPNYTDLTSFKSAIQGVILYYELATPIETIIEIDNRFEAITCEANGTITFEGADNNYHLPVPNEEEFMVKLSEV